MTPSCIEHRAPTRSRARQIDRRPGELGASAHRRGVRSAAARAPRRRPPPPAAALLWLAGGVGGWSSATAAEAPAVAVAPLTGGRVLEVAIGLVVVVAAIAVCAWVLRRTLRGVGAADGALRVVGGVSLGARERLLLVQVGERQLLLGVCPGRIETLYVLDGTFETPGPESAVGREFATQLSSVLDRMQRRRPHEPRS